MPARLISSASLVILSTALAYFSPLSIANATPQVYPGCAAPASAPKNIWHIDPVNGSENGDGSAARPWNSLQAVFNSVGGAAPLLSTAGYHHRGADGKWTSDNSGAPVKPGDKIELMSGQYGKVTVGARGNAINNSEFVTVEASPGQTPVLTSLNVGDASKFLFSGLTVEGLRHANDYISRVVLVGSDLIVANSRIMSAPDTSHWTREQWMTEASWLGAAAGGGRCLSFANNVIENVVMAVALAGENVLFANNTIQYFGWDGIDVLGVTNLSISHNNFLDHIGVNDAGNAWHSDAVQIFGKPSSHVVIDGNYIVQQTRADLPWPGKEANLQNDMHGLTDFGGSGNSGIVVTNNVVVVNNSNGIDFSAPGTQIINNTVLSNVSTTGGTWIHAQGAGSVIRNNIAPAIMANSPGITVDHNLADVQIAVLDEPRTPKNSWHPGKYWAGKNVGDHNFMDAHAFADVFKAYDPASFAYNLSLKGPAFDGITGNPAIGAGNAVDMPALDITGAKRTLPASLGAYAYGSASGGGTGAARASSR